MRVFLAIEIPEHIREKIMELENALKVYSKYMKLTNYNNLHFTVKFLGEQNDFSLNKIKSAAKDIVSGRESFKICIKKSGIFGSLKNPRILWLGENNRRFVDLALSLNDKLSAFMAEQNRPVCHLTVGRIKRIPYEDILDVLRTCRGFLDENDLCFDVSNVYLYKSTLARSGAVYDKIEKFDMKGTV